MSWKGMEFNMQKIKEKETAVSKNNNVIVMSKEELKKDIEEHLLKAEDDIRNGRVRDAREVFQEWKEKYGI